MKYAELFAGAGGMSLGLEAGGFHALAHAEIEPHARAVLRHRWPDTRLDGDVTTVNGADYAGITLLSGGSPCQDLSVAGKRAGLTGSRSSLFHEQCRIWRESGAPYLLWENVLGALSSNNGADFATVLSTIVGSAVAVPADGWRGGGGVVAGRDAVAAFRVLDLQHFGPPQRRVRVFVLAARAGGVDPAEVLALSEGVCGHPSPRQQSRESVAARARGGVESGVVPIDMRQVRRGATNTKSGRGGESVTSGTPGTGIGESGDPSYTLGSEGGPPAVIAWDNELNASTEAHGPLMARGKSGGDRNGVLAFHHTQDPISGDVSPVLGTTTGGMAVLAFNCKQDGTPNDEDVTPTLTAMQHRDGNENGGGQMGVLTFEPRYYTRDNKTGGAPSDVVKVDASVGKNGDAVPHIVCVSGDVSPAIAFNWQNGGGYGNANEGLAITVEGTGPLSRSQVLAVVPPQTSEDGTGRGTPIVLPTWPDVAMPLMARDAKGPRNFQDGGLQVSAVQTGRPRRLMPVECEKLMSWPSGWTATGRKDDGTEYALSDTARYRLCGNGVGSVCAEWIARRLHDAITGVAA